MIEDGQIPVKPIATGGVVDPDIAYETIARISSHDHMIYRGTPLFDLDERIEKLGFASGSITLNITIMSESKLTISPSFGAINGK
jgi:hypothetical protein